MPMVAMTSAPWRSAKIERHAENGTIIDEGRQRAQGKGPVTDQKGHVEDGMGRAPLRPQEEEKAGDAPGEEHEGPRALKQPDGADGHEAHGQRVGKAALPVEGIIGRVLPVTTHRTVHEQPRDDPDGHHAEKEELPTERGPEQARQPRPKRKPGIDADGSQAEHAPKLLGRRATHENGQRAGVHHGRAHRLHKTAEQEEPDVRHEGQQGRHDHEEHEPRQKEAFPADHVSHPARHQMEDGQRQRVGRVDEAQLHGARVQVPAYGGQERPRAGKHERQHELSGRDGDDDGPQRNRRALR